MVVHRIIAEKDGQLYEHKFGRLPRASWDPHQDFIFWVTPAAKRLSMNRPAEPGPAADAFEEYDQEEATTEFDSVLPSHPLELVGRAVRIYYRFNREGDEEWWHHDFDQADRFYRGKNTKGPRVFAVTGPDLQFTRWGIIN